MKKLLLTSFLLISFLVVGQCPTTPITITTQAEIDNFAITYPGCTNFEVSIYINGDGNNITNLNGLSQIETAYELNIANTDIIDFTGLNQLTLLEGPLMIELNNSLIDFTGLEQLSTVLLFNAQYNASLESFSGLDSFQSIIFIHEGIHIIGNPSLTTLEHLDNFTGEAFINITDNDALLNLNGLQNIGPLTTFLLEGNELINSIDALANVPVVNQAFFIIEHNPNLSNCSILSVCETLINGGNGIFSNNASGCNSIVEVLFNCTTSFNLISGTVSYDLGNNDCNNGSIPIGSVLLESIGGVNSIGTYSQENGTYGFLVDAGTYVTSVNLSNLPTYFDVVSNNIQSVFTGSGDSDIIDFCITAAEVATDLKVTIVRLDNLIPGFDSDFKVVIKNIGTATASGNLNIQFDDGRLTFVSANPVETNTTVSSISWDFTDLEPFSNQEFLYTLNSFPPPINELGDFTNFHAEITPVAGDETPEDNSYNLKTSYVNSQDPNDKTVNQGSEIEIGDVGGYLDYIIRFQNLGTADAVNVRVDDVLSENLDWDSFRPLSSSHGYRVEIINENEVSFIFDDINLPPEVSNPEGSNGFIAFQIRTSDTLEIGDNIENTASIFFDFNAPIITNTVTTTVVEPLSVFESTLSSEVRIYPNPTSKILSINASEGVVVESAIVYSILGEQLVVSSEKNINISTLSEGIYFITIKTNQGRTTKKIVKE